MSYDFMMFKPKIKISSPEDLGEESILKQNPQPVVDDLTNLFQSIVWRRETDGGWFGSLDNEEGWFEFRIGAEPDYAWSIHTSLRMSARTTIARICAALKLVAFDGQQNIIVDAENSGAT
jgi:hypothetical protein